MKYKWGGGGAQVTQQAFISWSGSIARGKARALRELLRYVLPDASIFMSEQDIPAGSLWLEGITNALELSVAGVVIITSENAGSPWLHFEAGALSNRVGRKMVIPLLAGVGVSAIAETPLSVFQAIALDKTNVFMVCKMFAEALAISRSENEIRRSFDKWWDDYEEELTSIKVDLTKPPPSLENVMFSLNRLQGFAKAQSDALSNLLARHSSPAPAIVGQGPLATMSTDTFDKAVSGYASKAIRDTLANSTVRQNLSKAADSFRFRVMITGEKWLGEITLDHDPVADEHISLDSGTVLVVAEVLYDPVNDSSTPDRLIIANRLKDGRSM
jgi:hypothetical protein